MKLLYLLTLVSLTFFISCESADSSETKIEVSVDDEGTTKKEGVTIEVTADSTSEVAADEHVHGASCNEGTHNCGEHCGCGAGCKCTVGNACSAACTPKKS